MNNPVKNKLLKNKIFYANLLLFSMIFSLYILISGQNPLNTGKNIFLVMSSAAFAAKYAFLTVLLLVISLRLPAARKAACDSTKEKGTFYFLSVLFVLSCILVSFKNTDRGWHAIFNGMFAVSAGVLYFRLNVFKKHNINPEINWPFYLVCLAAVLFIALGSASGFSFQNAYSTFSKDMGLFNNLIWRMGEDGSQFTVIEGLNDHRAVHFQPILYLLAVIFKIKCSPYILIFLQVFFAMGASVFLYMLALRLLKNKGASFFIVLAYLTGTYTARTFMYDYHPESMYMMMFFAFMYFAERGKFTVSVLFFCLGAAVKEEAAVYLALAGIYIFMRNGDKKYVALSICALLYAGIVIFAVMPAYNPGTGNWVEFLAGNAINLIKIETGASLFTQVFIFIFSAAFIPVLAGKPLFLIFLPPVLVHCVNYSDPSRLLFNMWYASFAVPALFAGTIYALNTKISKNRVFSENAVLIAFGIFLLQAQIHLAFMSDFSPGYSAAVSVIALILFIFPFTKLINRQKVQFSVFVMVAMAVFYFGYCSFHKSRMGNIQENGKESIKKAMQFIPSSKDAAVMTNSNIVTHLCCRKYIWAMDEGKAKDVFLPVLREKLSVFYMLVYLYDFTYAGNNIDPETRNREITELAQKNGFGYRFIYNDSITGVLEFTRR
jgi:uncharacterized membrane protein